MTPKIATAEQLAQAERDLGLPVGTLDQTRTFLRRLLAHLTDPAVKARIDKQYYEGRLDHADGFRWYMDPK